MAAQDSCVTINRQKLLDEVNRRQIKRDFAGPGPGSFCDAKG